MDIVYDALCTDPKAFGGYGYGGLYRTDQILALLKEGGCRAQALKREGIFFPRELRMKTWVKLWGKIRHLPFHEQHMAVHEYLLYRRALAGGGKLLLAENVEISIALQAARDAGAASYCLPQCWVSLWLGYKERYSSAEGELALRRHRQIYELASRVGWLGREEQWLAANLGLPSDWIPYFPPPARHAELTEIRNKRRSVSQSDSYLIIATENNSDDAEFSFMQQAEWLKQSMHRAGKVHVVGYAAEKYRSVWNDPLFTVHGKVSSEKLGELMSTSRALLGHGVRGLGTVTRLVDALVAGMPVVANWLAARSMYDLDGMRVYDAPEELAEALSLPFMSVCAVPQMLERKASHLVPILRSCLEARGNGSGGAAGPALRSTRKANLWSFGGR